jgi:hypothetical protein
LRFHQAPNLGCTCGLHGTRDPEVLKRIQSPAVVGTVSLWGRIIEHALGYRAQFGYPGEVRLVCPVCFFQQGVYALDAPAVVVALHGGQNMPLCARHLDTASAVELPIRCLTPAGRVLHDLLDIYGIDELPSGPRCEKTNTFTLNLTRTLRMTP